MKRASRQNLMFDAAYYDREAMTALEEYYDLQG